MAFRDLKITKDIRQVGKKRANPSVWADNMLKLRDRLTVDDAVSLDEVTISSASGSVINGVTFNGVAYVFDSPIDASKGDLFIAALKSSIFDVEGIDQEVDPIMVADYDATADETYIAHVGVLRLSSITVDATPAAITPLTTLYAEQAYSFVVAEGDTVTLSGESVTADQSIVISATAATTATNVETGINAGISGSAYLVTATDIAGTTNQLVTVYVDYGVSFTIDGASPTDEGSKHNFKA